MIRSFGFVGFTADVQLKKAELASSAFYDLSVVF